VKVEHVQAEKQKKCYVTSVNNVTTSHATMRQSSAVRIRHLKFCMRKSIAYEYYFNKDFKVR